MAENKTTTLEREDGPPQGTALDLDQPDEDRHQRTALAGPRPDAARFRDWLLQHQDHADDYVRTLAREVAADNTWPEDAETLEDLETYIAGHPHVDSRALEALARAWSLWRDQDQVDDNASSPVTPAICTSGPPQALAASGRASDSSSPSGSIGWR